MDLFIGFYKVSVDKNSDEMAKLESASIKKIKFNLGVINSTSNYYVTSLNDC